MNFNKLNIIFSLLNKMEPSLEPEIEKDFSLKYRYSKSFMLSFKDQEYTLPEETIEHFRSLGVLKGMSTPQIYHENNNRYDNKKNYKSKKYNRNFDKTVEKRTQLLKTEMSELIVLLNKFSEETFDKTFEELIKIFNKENIELEKYIIFLTDNIFKNIGHTIIELYAKLWIKLFQEKNVKNVYLNHCKYLFDTKKYEFYDGLTVTLIYFYKNKVIKEQVINTILYSMLKDLELLELKDLKGLYNLLQIISDEKLCIFIKELKLNNKHLIEFLNKENEVIEQQQTEFIYIGTKLLKEPCFEIKLVLDNIIINEISAEIIKNVDINNLVWFINKIKSDIFINENVITTINIIFSHKDNGKNIGTPLIDEILGYSKNEKYSKLDSKWKFKFMDFKDLYKRNWVKKVVTKTPKGLVMM
jgi:hypothetical protein